VCPELGWYIRTGDPRQGVRFREDRVIQRIGCAALALGLFHAAVAGQSTTETTLVRGTLLVATPELRDPNFAKTVVLVLNYDADGAMGLIVNRRTDLVLPEVVPDLEVPRHPRQLVHAGGPVAPEVLLMLFRSRDALEHSVQVFGDVWVSDSKELLERFAKNPKKTEFRVYTGYAGWAPRQLDAEVDRGDWIVLPADGDIVFHHNPSEVWRSLAPAEKNPFVTRKRDPTSFLQVAGLWYD
jgi:putative transcriptional regulator